MRAAIAPVQIERNAPIPTWFGIGGRADRLARPQSAEELAACIESDSDLRILGDGANLLVDDPGVAELVVKLDAPCWKRVEIERDSGRVFASAGADLPRMILDTVRAGLSGLEGLGGVPASVGGALVMNAGGRFGEIGNVVSRVFGLDRTGAMVVRSRDEAAFAYRSSGLKDLIVTGVELSLTPADPAKVREHLLEVMDYKKKSQPMSARCAGCCFKNPTLTRDVAGVGERGQRVSAGMVIDRAGCKGLQVGGASVSERHANFLVTAPDARARDVIELMENVAARVQAEFGIVLEPEVVVWRRTP